MNTEKLDVKKGIERLARVYCWPNEPSIADKDKYEFKALCEFALFKQFVMIPFFKSLLKYLLKHIARLYQYVASLHIENAHMLTYKEAYLFMRDLEVEKVKLILEQVSCPSNVYNGIIRSLEEENYNLFFSALDKSDHTKMMQVLWMMRYILLGEKGNWDNIDPATPHLALLPYLPRWIKMDDYYYRPYFEIHEYDDEDIFIDERVIEIVDGRLRKKKRTDNNPSPINNHSDNFEEDNKKELDRLFEESLFKSQWKDLLTEYSDNGNLLLGMSMGNRSYIEDLAKLILTHNVILHKDFIMEKYGVDSSEIYNQFVSTDGYTYEGGDRKDLGRYILYYTGEMLYIYNKVEAILSDETKDALNNILCGSYTISLINPIFVSSVLGGKEEVNPVEMLEDRVGTFGRESRKACGIEDKYQALINQWKIDNSNYSSFNKGFVFEKGKDHDLSESQIRTLFEQLSSGEEPFIEKRTNFESFHHVFGGSRPKDYEPVIWIKKAKNQTPHKKALRNLLVRLRIKNIDLVKLNYCFVLPNKNGKIAVFEYKDLKDSKNNSPKTPSDKYFVEILEIVFKGNEYQLTQMRNAINS